jgi:hypothetical protein
LIKHQFSHVEGKTASPPSGPPEIILYSTGFGRSIWQCYYQYAITGAKLLPAGTIFSLYIRPQVTLTGPVQRLFQENYATGVNTIEQNRL